MSYTASQQVTADQELFVGKNVKYLSSNAIGTAVVAYVTLLVPSEGYHLDAARSITYDEM